MFRNPSRFCISATCAVVSRERTLASNKSGFVVGGRGGLTPRGTGDGKWRSTECDVTSEVYSSQRDLVLYCQMGGRIHNQLCCMLQSILLVVVVVIVAFAAASHLIVTLDVQLAISETESLENPLALLDVRRVMSVIVMCEKAEVGEVESRCGD